MQLSLGSLKNDDSNGDDNRCRRRCRRRFFARVARFVHFFAVAARLQDESAKFHVLSRKGTPNNNLPLYLYTDVVLFSVSFFWKTSANVRARRARERARATSERKKEPLPPTPTFLRWRLINPRGLNFITRARRTLKR